MQFNHRPRLSRFLIALFISLCAASCLTASPALADESDGLANSWRYENGEPIDESEIIADEEAEESDDASASSQSISAQGSYDYSIFGIDVSQWQGTINWSSVKSSGVSYAIIRCGYGSNKTSYDDPQWLNNVKGCVNNNIPFGVYIYSYATTTTGAASEANHVIRLLKEAGLSNSDIAFPIYYDMEDSSTKGLSAAQYASMFNTFRSTLNAAGYTNVGVYANADWWKNRLYKIDLDGEYRWIAHYGCSSPFDYGYSSLSSVAYGIWQYSSSGSVSGISGNVDCNYARADLSFLSTVFTRLSGSDRYATMKAALDATWSSGSASYVVLASGDNFPDALAASGLAGVLDAPVVITSGSSLSSAAASEIARVASSGGCKVVIVGGTGAVSSKAASQASALSGVSGVERVWGSDRYATAEAVYEYGRSHGGWGSEAVVASGTSYPDALSASSYAYAAEAPVFLTSGRRLTSSEASSLASGGFSTVLVLGGSGVVDSSSVASSAGGAQVAAFAGSDRYQTSALFATWACGGSVSGVSATPSTPLSWDGVCVASALNFPDALVASGVAGPSGSPLLLVSDGQWSRAASLLSANADSITSGYILGGTGVISSRTEARLNAAIA